MSRYGKKHYLSPSSIIKIVKMEIRNFLSIVPNSERAFNFFLDRFLNSRPHGTGKKFIFVIESGISVHETCFKLCSKLHDSFLPVQVFQDGHFHPFAGNEDSSPIRVFKWSEKELYSDDAELVAEACAQSHLFFVDSVMLLFEYISNLLSFLFYVVVPISLVPAWLYSCRVG
jgi:hypothetical protein